MPIEKSEKHKADNNKRILVVGDVLGKFTKLYERLKVIFLSIPLFLLCDRISLIFSSPHCFAMLIPLYSLELQIAECK